MTLIERIKEVLERPDSQERGKQIFILHNEAFPNKKETYTYCYGCRKRVENKLKQYLIDQEVKVNV